MWFASGGLSSFGWQGKGARAGRLAESRRVQSIHGSTGFSWEARGLRVVCSPGCPLLNYRCSTGSAALSLPPILPSASWLRARCEHNTDAKHACWCWPCFSACKRTDRTRIAQMGGILGNLQPAPGSKKPKTRKGRGIAAGQGATCGFGMRGQKSRGGRPTRLAGGERKETFTPLNALVNRAGAGGGSARNVHKGAQGGRVQDTRSLAVAVLGATPPVNSRYQRWCSRDVTASRPPERPVGGCGRLWEVVGGLSGR